MWHDALVIVLCCSYSAIIRFKLCALVYFIWLFAPKRLTEGLQFLSLSEKLNFDEKKLEWFAMLPNIRYRCEHVCSTRNRTATDLLIRTAEFNRIRELVVMLVQGNAEFIKSINLFKPRERATNWSLLFTKSIDCKKREKNLANRRKCGNPQSLKTFKSRSKLHPKGKSDNNCRGTSSSSNL